MMKAILIAVLGFAFNVVAADSSPQTDSGPEETTGDIYCGTEGCAGVDF